MDLVKVVERLDAREFAYFTKDKRVLGNKSNLVRKLSDFIVTLKCLMLNPKALGDITAESVVSEEFGNLPNCQLKQFLLALTNRALI